MTKLTIQQARQMVCEAKREERLSTEAVAAVCDVQVATVREWIRSGHLRGVRIGRRRLYVPCDEVYRFVHGQRRVTQ
jgi:excisionase family DNA binding protein